MSKLKDRIEADEAAKAKLAEVLAKHNFASSIRVNPDPAQSLLGHFEGHRHKFIRGFDSFILKGKTRNSDKLLLSLARHFFVKFRVPKILDQVWLTDEPPTTRHPWYGGQPREAFVNRFKEYRSWYICVATGGSLHKEFAKYWFTKQETHLFLNCPYDLTISQAFVYAVAMAENKDVGTALKLAKSKWGAHSSRNTSFKFDCIRFFAREGNTPETVSQFDDIIDYIEWEHRENPNFKIFGMGHTLKSILVKVEEWHRALGRMKILGESFWDGHGIADWEFIKAGKDEIIPEVWNCKQILNARDLAKEGTAMRHCVLGYKDRCVRSDISIWSLTQNGKRKLTIELGNDGYIRQARGIANRIPTNEEFAVLVRWATENYLTCPDSLRGGGGW